MQSDTFCYSTKSHQRDEPPLDIANTELRNLRLEPSPDFFTGMASQLATYHKRLLQSGACTMIMSPSLSALGQRKRSFIAAVQIKEYFKNRRYSDQAYVELLSR